MNKRKYYTVYLTKDESVVAFGDITNIARMLGLSKSTVRPMISKASKGEYKKYEIEIEELEDINEFNIA